MKSLSIVIVCPSLTSGGAEKVAVNLANEFVKRSITVYLILFKCEGPLKQQLSERVNVVNLNLNPVNNVFVFRYPFLLRRQLNSIKPDIVLSVIRSTNLITGFATLGNRSLKVVCREASTIDGINTSGFFKRVLYKWGLKLAYWRTDAFIANSNDTLNGFVQHKLVQRTKSFVIPNPVLPEGYMQLAEEDIDDIWWPNDSSKIIISIGRLHEHKNFPFLINAFHKLHLQCPRTKLIIFGEGPEKDNLSNLISLLGLKGEVILPGFRYNVFNYLRNADVFALSSKWEGFGNVIVEALSVGTPVVVADCPGGPKMILDDGKYGTLVNPSDEQAFVEALFSVLENPPQKDLLIKRANDYSIDIVANRYLSILLDKN